MTLILCFICFIVGMVVGILTHNNSRAAQRPSSEIIDEFKRSAEFSRIMDEYADYKISIAKQTGLLSSEVVKDEATRNLHRGETESIQSTSRPEFDFKDVQFLEDTGAAFTQQDIARFKENRIPSEWLRPLKEPSFKNRFTGKKVVITGVFSFDRIALAELLWKSGADLDTAINAKTDFVIKGENAGWRKCEQIEELGLTCISENEILKDFPEL